MKQTLTKSGFITEVKACLFLAIPLAGAQLAQTATGFVDTVMMGWLGSQTLAAGGLGAVTFTFLLLVTTGILAAVSPLVAEAYGAGKPEMAGRAMCQGLWLSVILAIPCMAIAWYATPLLRLLGQEAENIALTETYLRAIAWGYFPSLGFAVLKNFITALSEPRPVIAIIICGTLLNIAANYILMFGKLGLPALGLAGIGWASTLSLWSMFIALAIYITSQHRFDIYAPFRHLQQFEGRIFWELVKIGLPIGILCASEGGSFTVITFLMGQLGTATLAAHQIALQTIATTFTVPLGISFATTVRVGQLMGQENYQGARLAGYIGMGMGGLFMGLMAIMFWAIPDSIVSLYIDIKNPANAAVINLAEALLGVAAMFQIVDGIQVNAAGALRGVKDTRFPMLIGILAYWCIGLTIGYLLGIRLGFGGVGLWWGLAIGLAVAAGVLSWRFSTAQFKPDAIAQNFK